MTRAVVDPGVFVSAVVKPNGPPGRLVEAAEAGAFVVIGSPLLLRELLEVLARERFQRYASREERTAFAHHIEELMVRVDDPADRPPATEDPDDDYLVALTRASKADVLVSGDADLVDAALPDVTVLRPKQFLDTLLAAGDTE